MAGKVRRGVGMGMQDRAATLFEPDILLPAQFFAAFRREEAMQQEKRLMLAVLEDAVDCYQKHAFTRDLRGRQLFEEAHQWVFLGDRTWLFSFENICEVLGINPEYVRRGLTLWSTRPRGRRGTSHPPHSERPCKATA